MKNIDKQIALLYFERIEDYISTENYSPKERIPKYRSILDDLFKALTIDAKVYLNGLNARSIYISQEHEIPKHILRYTNSLRIFANKVVHESELIPTELDDKRCVFQLAEILKFYSNLGIPEKILTFYKESLEEIKKDFYVKKPLQPVYEFFAVVLDVYSPIGENANKLCILTCSTDNLGDIKLKLWNNKNESGFGSDLASIGKIAERYQNIYISEVHKNSDKEDEYSATEHSLLVLEPDYLLDAKELSECRQFSPKAVGQYEDNPLLFILNRFTKGEVTDRIMVGNIVGKMLDDIVIEREYKYASTFETVMREDSFGMLCMANKNGSYDRTKIQATYIEASDHEKKLKHVLEIYKNQQIILEPTFISSKYGLQGRLDMLIDYGGNSNQKDIIELKSSRNYPKTNLGLYLNHEAQTMCYDLLISSTYPGRQGNTSILYSSAPIEEKPLRNVGKEKYLQMQELLMLRNRIVASELKLARGDFKPFLDILSDSFGPYPKYLEEQVESFKATIESLDSVLKQYFYGMLKFIYRELQVAKIGSNDSYSKSNGYAELWKASRSEKIENSDVLIYLKIGEVSDNFHIKLNFDRDNLFSSVVSVSSFRVGDTAVLYPTPDPEDLNPLKSQILKCHVLQVNPDYVLVSLINKQLDKSYFKTSQYWALERDFRELGYKQQLQLLYEFVNSDKRVVDLVLGIQKPVFDNTLEISNNSLDEVQFLNVRNAVRAQDYYLIQGPPGTGKTSKVLVEIVRNLSGLNTNVLVVAYTNRAVDEICEKLIQLDIKCIRLGKGDKHYYLSHLSSRLKLDELNAEILNTKVIVSTISTFTSNIDILKFKKFETLIVDEASQVLEPQIIGFLKHFKKWIFIGDENQLPAVVVQSETDSKCTNPELIKLSLSNYRESLFYRLKKNAVVNSWTDCYGILKYQYRMHIDIADFPKKKFYNNELEEVNDSQRIELPDYSRFEDVLVNPVLTKSRIVFIPSTVDFHEKINNEEAKLVAELIKHIATIYGVDFNPEKTVGVISPFRAQIANIRNNLKGKYNEITIDTIERFQGSERDIIIMSFAVKSTTQLAAIQSINDEKIDRKLNVALTRAKNQLILIGSEDVLNKNMLYKELIEHIKERNGYLLNPLKTKIIPTNLF